MPALTSQGPRTPTTIVTVAGGGLIDWTNSGNVISSNDSYATADMASDDVSYALDAVGFGFSLPSEATITGVMVEIERSKSGAGVIRDFSVMLLDAGIPIGNDRADSGTDWPSSDSYASYGGTSDLWGDVWTAAKVNASNFGIRLMCQAINAAAIARVDNIRVTISYTVIRSELDLTLTSNLLKTGIFG